MPTLPPSGGYAPEPDRFGRAFLAALALEGLAILVFAFAPQPPPVPPAVIVQVHVLQPAPVPVAKPPPPIPPPPTPPPPVPTPPVPVTPPLPLPPPPPKPADHPAHVRHVVKPPPPPPPATPPIQAPAAPITAAPAVSNVAADSALSRYIGEISAIIRANLHVPERLIQAGLSGTTRLQFTVAPNGELVSAYIIGPSGISAADDAAMAALRASRFPAFLAGMPDGPHVFTVPIRVSGEDQ